MKPWKILYLIGFPMLFVALWMLHEEIWPGRGIFMNAFGNAGSSAIKARPAGDFSGILSFRFAILYYLPVISGLVMCGVATWLRRAEVVPKHVLYSEMADDD